MKEDLHLYGNELNLYVLFPLQFALLLTHALTRFL